VDEGFTILQERVEELERERGRDSDRERERAREREEERTDEGERVRRREEERKRESDHEQVHILKSVAVCCNVWHLDSVAVRCTVLQRVAAC